MTPQTLYLVEAKEKVKVDLDLLSKLQEQASQKEKAGWEKQGSVCLNGIWATSERCCLPRVLYPMMTQIMHGSVHNAKEAMVNTPSSTG